MQRELRRASTTVKADRQVRVEAQSGKCMEDIVAKAREMVEGDRGREPCCYPCWSKRCAQGKESGHQETTRGWIVQAQRDL